MNGNGEVCRKKDIPRKNRIATMLGKPGIIAIFCIRERLINLHLPPVLETIRIFIYNVDSGNKLVFGRIQKGSR